MEIINSKFLFTKFILLIENAKEILNHMSEKVIYHEQKSPEQYLKSL